MTQICQWPPSEAMRQVTYLLVGAKVCDLTEDLLWFVCGLYVGILMSSLSISEVWDGPTPPRDYCTVILLLSC